MFFIAGADPALLPLYLLINLVCMASFLPYGFLTALYARDQNSVNVYSTLSVILAFVIHGIFLLEPGVWQYRCIYPHQFQWELCSAR